jgi:hypothetical protein
MRNRWLRPTVAVAAVLAVSPIVFGQTTAPPQLDKAKPEIPARDLSGVWYGPMELNMVPESVGMLPWAEAKFNSERTEYKVGNRPTVKDNTNTDPILHCNPVGIPRIYWSIHPFEIIQLSGRIMIYYEEFHEVRDVWMDGRPIPKDPDPTWLGTSIGHWDGNDLVIDTVGFNDKTWLDSVGHPHTQDLHLTERFHRVDHDTMEVSITFDDPKAYKASWTYGPKPVKLKPGWEIGELFCTIEDEKQFEKDIMNPSGKP